MSKPDQYLVSLIAMVLAGGMVYVFCFAELDDGSLSHQDLQERFVLINEGMEIQEVETLLCRPGKAGPPGHIRTYHSDPITGEHAAVR